MKSLKIAAALSVILIILYAGQRLGEHVARRLHVEWTAIQSQRCSALGGVLYQYFEKNGSYPDELEDLVTAGFITQDDYDKLRFQENRNSEPLEWSYRNPGTSHHYLLFSGKPVKVWNCPIRSYVAGGIGGSAIVFGEEKLASFRRNQF